MPHPAGVAGLRSSDRGGRGVPGFRRASRGRAYLLKSPTQGVNHGRGEEALKSEVLNGVISTEAALDLGRLHTDFFLTCAEVGFSSPSHRTQFKRVTAVFLFRCASNVPPCPRIYVTCVGVCFACKAYLLVL